MEIDAPGARRRPSTPAAHTESTRSKIAHERVRHTVASKNLFVSYKSPRARATTRFHF
jgi:hypothetical protein